MSDYGLKPKVNRKGLNSGECPVDQKMAQNFEVILSVCKAQLRARAKITSHFDISSSSHFRQFLKSKNLEILQYYCSFCFLKSTKPNINLSAKNVKLFLREP